MKRKLLSTLVLVAACNTYALPLEGSKVIKHSETVSPNTTLSFQQGINNKFDLLKSKLDLKTRDGNFSLVQVIEQLGDIKTAPWGGTIVEANPSNFTFIFNETTQPKEYKITHEICVGPKDQPATMCAGSFDVILVEPCHMHHDRMIPIFEAQLKPGTYSAVLRTSIEPSNQTDNTEVYDFKEFTVSN